MVRKIYSSAIGFGRAKKFAKNYFNSEDLEMSNCLKDCFNLHKWLSIQGSMKDISQKL